MSGWLQRLLRRSGVSGNAPDSRLEQPLRTVSILGLDFELTGLDPANAHITSVGWVQGTGVSISPATSFYSTVKTLRSLEQSPVIHGLTAPVIRQGVPVRKIMQQVYPLINSHIIICHHALLEQGMLVKLAASFRLDTSTLIIIDTMQVARYLLLKQGAVISHNSLKLSVCRKRYSLPDAPEHDALADAQACYELWLAQACELGIGPEDPISRLSHTGALIVKKVGKKHR